MVSVYWKIYLSIYAHNFVTRNTFAAHHMCPWVQGHSIIYFLPSSVAVPLDVFHWTRLKGSIMTSCGQSCTLLGIPQSTVKRKTVAEQTTCMCLRIVGISLWSCLSTNDQLSTFDTRNNFFPCHGLTAVIFRNHLFGRRLWPEWRTSPALLPMNGNTIMIMLILLLWMRASWNTINVSICKCSPYNYLFRLIFVLHYLWWR